MLLFVCLLLTASTYGLEGAKQPDCKCLEPGNSGKKFGIVADKKTELVAVATLTSSLPSGTVSGTAHFYQSIVSGIGLQATTIKVELEGLPAGDGSRGWHIHQFGNLSAQTAGRCLSAGGHYNPHNVNHGDPSADPHHAGDLGNFDVHPDGKATYSGVFPDVDLIGVHSVIGRALTIHLRRDDLGHGAQPASTQNGNSGDRIACGVIGWAGDTKTGYRMLQGKKAAVIKFHQELSAIAVIQPANSQSKVTGVVLFTQGSVNAKAKLKVSLAGFPTKAKDYSVGWHIHEYADLTANGANGICGSVGGHYNPKNATHGGPVTHQHHKGDLGNLPVKKDGTAVFSAKFDAVDLNGIYSVAGRSIVIHAKQDDLGVGDQTSKENGNSGARLACGVIGWATEPGEALRLA